MTLEEQCALSYYREIGKLNEAKNVLLVQHTENGRIFVRKDLRVYEAEVFRYLKAHPVCGIPRVYEAVEEDGTLTVIEEYVSGQTLQEVLSERSQEESLSAGNGRTPSSAAEDPGPEDRNLRSAGSAAPQPGTLSCPETVALSLQLCEILARLHGAEPPIVHRDIKPSNIILTPDGNVKLIDLNAARIPRGAASRDTRLMGTAGYAAPEQYGFRESDARTDIYALGVLMNVLLTGALPDRIRADGPLRPVIDRCTQLDPDRRYQTVRMLETDLRQLQNPAGRCLDGAGFESGPAGCTSDADTFKSGSAGSNSWLSGFDPDLSVSGSSGSGADVQAVNFGSGMDVRSGDFGSGTDVRSGKSDFEAEARSEESDPDAAAGRKDAPEPGKSPRRFLPPGFRSGRPWKMVIAVFGYFMMFECTASIQVGSNPADILLNRAAFLLAAILIILFTCSWLGVRDRFPLARSSRRMVRLAGILMWDVLLFLLVILILVIVELALGWQ